MPNPQNDLDWPAYADEIGLRLSTVRRAQGVTQLDLANATGMARNQVQNIERSRSSAGRPGNTTIRTVFILARALGVPPALLLPDVAVVPGHRSRRAIDLTWPQIEAELVEAVRVFPLPPETLTSTRVH